jgi:hypothetical protein
VSMRPMRSQSLKGPPGRECYVAHPRGHCASVHEVYWHYLPTSGPAIWGLVRRRRTSHVSRDKADAREIGAQHGWAAAAACVPKRLFDVWGEGLWGSGGPNKAWQAVAGASRIDDQAITDNLGG